MKIELGPERLRFSSHEDWVQNTNVKFGKLLFRQGQDTICIDAKRRICRIGRDFSRARDEKAFPVIGYAIRSDVE